MPWANTDRILYAESYFESVPAAEEWWNNGFRFIGVINTATRKFLMVNLSNTKLHNRVDMSGLLTRQVDRTKLVLGPFFWMDQNRRYFIFTGGYMEK